MQEGGGASSALQSLLSGGGGGGADPSLTLGTDIGAKNINEGASATSLEGKTLISNPQGGMFGSPNTYGLASSLVDLVKKILQFDLKGIADEIANMAKSDSSEITGDNAAPVQQVQSADEVNGNDKAAIVALDLSAFTKMNIEGVEASGPIVANAPAASNDQMQIG